MVKTLTEEDIIEGGLYQLLAPKDGKLETWCRHNTVKAVKTLEESLRFTDTYWAGSGGRGVYPFDEVKGRLVYLFDLTYGRSVSKREWMEYSEKDRIHIPIGGRPERWLIDTRAEKNKVCVISVLEEDIARLKSTIEISQRELDIKNKELDGRMEAAGE
jgi:hypothetical protein